jgi:hypothetical protein
VLFNAAACNLMLLRFAIQLSVSACYYVHCPVVLYRHVESARASSR